MAHPLNPHGGSSPDPTDADVSTEEDVKIKVLLPLLENHGYSLDCCEFEKAIEVQEGRRRKQIFADVIIYSSPTKDVPLVCCETKAPNEVLDRAAREQAISYARLLPKIAPLALLTNGRQVQVFQTLNKNRIDALPHRRSLDDDLLNFIVSRQIRDALRAEAKHELFIIDDVQTFKRILKSCHDQIRNNEGYDPTEAFDELSKVLFCKMYEEKRTGQNRFRLSVFDETLASLGINVVQRIFEETTKDPRYSALFGTNQRIQLQDRTLRRIVQLFESTDLSLTAFDVKGEAFEYFLGDTFTGGLGQYFTPRTVVQFIVDAIELKIGEKIVDPFCGTGGFLIHAFETVSEQIRFQRFAEAQKELWRIRLSNESLYGTDWAARTSQTCKMNMVVHGDGSAGIVKHHGLVDVAGLIEEGWFQVCLTNPPFGSFETDPAILAAYELGAARTSQDRVILAVERALRLVDRSGRVGMVVIDGILNNSSTRYVRDFIRRHAKIRAVIGLARETFEGYGGRSDTSVLLLDKKPVPDEGAQEPVFFAIARNTGYAPNGDPIPGNELPDILLEYQAFRRGEEVGRLASAWVVNVEDRLDPTYYEPDRRSAAPSGSIAAQVNGLGEKLTSIIDLTQNVQEDLLSLPDESYTEWKLADVLTEVRDPVKLEPEAEYRLLGVKWWGEGCFEREVKKGREIKAKALYRVQAGMFVYNRLFAFRGSFAVVAPEQGGAMVSNEFPVFEPKSNAPHADLVCRYLVHCLNSPASLTLVDARSSGSTKTSRNRFMQAMFLELVVKIPKSPEDTQRAIDAMDAALYAKIRLKEEIEQVSLLHKIAGNALPAAKRGFDNT